MGKIISKRHNYMKEIRNPRDAYFGPTGHTLINPTNLSIPNK